MGVLQLSRIKKQTKSRRWSKLRGAVKGGHVHKSHTKHKSLHIKHTSREVKEDQPVNNTKNSNVIDRYILLACRWRLFHSSWIINHRNPSQCYLTLIKKKIQLSVFCDLKI